MTKKETIEIMTLLAGNYNAIADKTTKQLDFMLYTWYECLKDLDYEIVLNAVKRVIINSPYPPTVHEVRKNAIEIINPTTYKTAIEAWNEALNMICNGIYMTEEEFNTYSPEVRRFFGTVNQVRQLAMLDVEIINSVTKGQFLKQYDLLVQREQEEKMLPEELKNTFNLLADKMDVNKLLNGGSKNETI